MIRQSLFGMALALATATLAAQAPKPTTASPKPTTAAPRTATPQPQKDQNGYVPAIEQKLVTVSGCRKIRNKKRRDSVMTMTTDNMVIR